MRINILEAHACELTRSAPAYYTHRYHFDYEMTICEGARGLERDQEGYAILTLREECAESYLGESELRSLRMTNGSSRSTSTREDIIYACAEVC